MFAEQWVQSCLDDEAVTRPQFILKHGASREDLQTVDLLAASLPSNPAKANNEYSTAPPSSCSSVTEEACTEVSSSSGSLGETSEAHGTSGSAASAGTPKEL